MERKRTVSISCYEGHFNFANFAEKQWQLVLITPYGNLSELFDEEPCHGNGVEDVIETISQRLESYWASSLRKEKRETIATIRKHLNECEILLREAELVKIDKSLERLTKERDSIVSTIQYLRDEMADAENVA